MKMRLFLFCPFLSAVLLTNVVHAESKLYTTTLHSSRPLEEAIDKLEEIYALPISYEEPPYTSGDQSDNNKKFPNGLAFNYELPAATTTDEERAKLATNALTDLLKAYNTAFGIEMFQAIEINGGFDVIPLNYIDATGKAVKASPLLDTPISIKEDQKGAGPIIRDIMQETANTSGTTIIPGTGIPDHDDTWITSYWASNESARAALVGLFSQLPIVGSKRVILNQRVVGGGPEPGIGYSDVPAHYSWRLINMAPKQYRLKLRLITPPGSMGGLNAPYAPPTKEELEKGAQTQKELEDGAKSHPPFSLR